MPAYRFYLDHSLEEGAVIRLPSAEEHHLTRVMRCKAGDTIEIVNGKGALALGKLEANHLITLISLTQSSPPRDLILAQGIPKLNHLETIVEKGTELGMTALLLFPADRSEKKELSETQAKRLQQISISALKQCGRFYLPEIKVIEPIQAWKKVPTLTLFGSLSAEAPWLKQSADETMIVIGPEAGLSERELNILSRLGGKGVRLHSHILRAETASLAALALLSFGRPVS